MRKAIVSAQRTADAMVAEAERKCAQILGNAEADAQSKEADSVVAKQIERMNHARLAAKNFIEVLEQDIRGHLDLLEKLKNEDLEEEPVPAAAEAPRPKPFDYELDEMPLVMPKAEAPAESESPAEIASAIEQNITKIMDIEAPEEPAPAEDEAKVSDSTIKFSNLQFGKNYDPTTTE